MTRPNGELALVVVAFWRRTDNGIELLTPLFGTYMDTMSHRTNRTFATAARRWVNRKFGFNPRSNARVFPTAAAHVVAFELNKAELNRMRDDFVWIPAASVEVPAIFGLQCAVAQL